MCSKRRIKRCPVKQKRAPLESDPPRDNRMRWEKELSERTVEETEEDAIDHPLG